MKKPTRELRWVWRHTLPLRAAYGFKFLRVLHCHMPFNCKNSSRRAHLPQGLFLRHLKRAVPLPAIRTPPITNRARRVAELPRVLYCAVGALALHVPAVARVLVRAPIRLGCWFLFGRFLPCRLTLCCHFPPFLFPTPSLRQSSP